MATLLIIDLSHVIEEKKIELKGYLNDNYFSWREIEED